MSVDLRLTAGNVEGELARIGLKEPKVEVERVDPAASTFIVTVMSSSFDGQTYLDREMRCRPAITRVLSPALPAGSTFVIEALTPEERDDESAEMEPPNLSFGLDGGTNPEERANRRRWRETRQHLLRALERSQYDVEPLEEGSVYSASRSGLAKERILLAFAAGTNAKTVDLETRRTLQEMRKVQHYAGVYYVSPELLETPWANQTRAEWMELCTPIEFLHSLNSSTKLARRLHEHCTKDLRGSAPEQNGPVIEPAVRVGEEIMSEGFFEHVRQWASAPGPSFLVMVAPAGHGKTTLALNLTRTFAADFLASSESEPPVPLFVGFESVRRTVDFEALMHKRFAELRAGALGAFAELLRARRAVLLVDGFDELAEDAGLSVAEAQVRSMRPLLEGGAKVILAGRSVFAYEFAGGQQISERIRSLVGDISVEVIEVLPFGENEIGEYTRSREGLTKEDCKSVIDFAEASPDHADLCGNPLFLRMLCSLAAARRLPAPDEVTAGVDALITKVCEREEDRQHLGLGVDGQMAFLTWVAQEMFRAMTATGRSVLNPDDVRAMAGALLDGQRQRRDELIGRLVDHALLSPAGAGQLTFIHPFIRDVLLARVALGEELRLGSLVAIGDLPEGTVDHLARSTAAQGCPVLRKSPAGWLSDGTLLPSQVRRNLVRLAITSARFVSNGNPRNWYYPEWIRGATIASLDLSGMIVESASFRGLMLSGCRFESTLFDDCDFDGTTFSGCALTYTMFLGVHFDGASAVRGGQVVEALFRGDNRAAVFQSPEEFDAWLRSAFPPQTSLFPTPSQRVVSADVVQRCRALVAALLRLIVDLSGGAPKFYRVGREAFEHNALGVSSHSRDREAIQRVLVPGLIASLCYMELQKGSRQSVGLEKRWYDAVARFLRDGHVTSGLEEVLARLCSKSARYLE